MLIALSMDASKIAINHIKDETSHTRLECCAVDLNFARWIANCWGSECNYVCVHAWDTTQNFEWLASRHTVTHRPISDEESWRWNDDWEHLSICPIAAKSHEKLHVVIVLPLLYLLGNTYQNSSMNNCYNWFGIILSLASNVILKVKNRKTKC